jgi:hypothetical protein
MYLNISIFLILEINALLNHCIIHDGIQTKYIPDQDAILREFVIVDKQL